MILRQSLLFIHGKFTHRFLNYLKKKNGMNDSRLKKILKKIKKKIKKEMNSPLLIKDPKIDSDESLVQYKSLASLGKDSSRHYETIKNDQTISKACNF